MILNQNGSFQIAEGPGKLVGVDILASGNQSTLLLYDGIDETGTQMALLYTVDTHSTAFAVHSFEKGLFAVARGAAPAEINIRLG